jgi:membrane protein
MLVALPAFALLALGVLSATGSRDVWEETLGPPIRDRVTAPVYTGLDFTVDRVFETGATSLVVVASLLLVWELSRAVRTVMKALNVVFELEERRTKREIVVTDLALALGVGALLALAIVVVTIVPRLVDGWLAVLLKLGAWAAAVVLLGLAVALLVRYAPAQRPEASWASAGAVLTIAGWILASVLFAWWAGSVADYKSAVGALTVFLILAAYVFTLCAIFLGGVQVDAIARAELKQRR